MMKRSSLRSHHRQELAIHLMSKTMTSFTPANSPKVLYQKILKNKQKLILLISVLNLTNIYKNVQIILKNADGNSITAVDQGPYHADVFVKAE